MRSLLPWLLAVSAFGQESLSVEKEAALGAQVAADLRSRTVQINDQAVADYVQHITDRLAPHVESPFPWRVVVIQDTGEARAVEAVSIPGGYIFIPASLILKAGSEYDVAEVTAHAMAHIAQRFVWREPGKIPLIFVGGRGNWQSRRSCRRRWKRKPLRTPRECCAKQATSLCPASPTPR